MNYIKQLNSLFDIQALNPISTNELALYICLLHINNKLNWKERFNVPNDTLTLLSGLPRTTMHRVRNKLVQMGLIEYYKGTTNKQAPEYKLFPLYDTSSGTNTGTNFETNNGTNNGTNSGNIHKLNKTKLNETKKEKNKKEKTALDVIKNSGLDDDVINLLVEFKKMRDLKKKPLTAYAMELRIKELNNLSADKATQLEIIKQTITSNWDRFYQLKKQKATNSWAYMNNKKNQYEQRQFEDINSLYD